MKTVLLKFGKFLKTAGLGMILEIIRRLRPSNNSEIITSTIRGATGHTGKKITEALLTAGEKLRA